MIRAIAEIVLLSVLAACFIPLTAFALSLVGLFPHWRTWKW